MADSVTAVADPTTAQPGVAGSRPVARKKSFAPLIIAAVIAVIGFFVIGTSTSGGAGNYNYTLAQLVAEKDAVNGRNIKVSGTIATGSVRGEPASKSFRFDLTDAEGNKVAIAYTKLLPDPFEEGREAIVQGRYEAGTLHASNLTVKCPSRYEDAESLTPEQREAFKSADPSEHQKMLDAYKKK